MIRSASGERANFSLEREFSRKRSIGDLRSLGGPGLAIGRKDQCSYFAGSNPRLDDFLLFGREGFAGLGRRHEFVFVFAVEAEDQFALVGLTGDDDGIVAEVLEGSFLCVQSEVCFAGTLVRAVAMKAVLGEEGANVLCEVDGRFAECQRGNRQKGSAEKLGIS